MRNQGLTTLAISALLGAGLSTPAWGESPDQARAREQVRVEGNREEKGPLRRLFVNSSWKKIMDIKPGLYGVDPDSADGDLLRFKVLNQGHPTTPELRALALGFIKDRECFDYAPWPGVGKTTPDPASFEAFCNGNARFSALDHVVVNAKCVSVKGENRVPYVAPLYCSMKACLEGAKACSKEEVTQMQVQVAVDNINQKRRALKALFEIRNKNSDSGSADGGR
jgi:hypothetical protein